MSLASIADTLTHGHLLFWQGSPPEQVDGIPRRKGGTQVYVSNQVVPIQDTLGPVIAKPEAISSPNTF